MEVKSCCIFFNKDKELANDFYHKLKLYLMEKKIEILDEKNIKEANFAVVIGGDGTFLRASKMILKNINIHTLAVNAGSLGFLTEIKLEEAISVIESYLKGDYKLDERRFLQVKVKNKVYDALNEVVVAKGGITSKLIRVSAYNNGGHINTYRADGLIISTPTGSTAYSLSAGGPIIAPDIKGICITPIAPHNLSTRPLIISDNSNLTFKIEDEIREGIVVIDGDTCFKVSNQDSIEISYGEKKINLITGKNTEYYSILREKLKWGDKLC